MTEQVHACRVIAANKLLESAVTCGFYVALAVGMGLGLYLVSGFANSIGSSGFDPALNPVYDQLYRTLAAGFGRTFVVKLFSQGPFGFAFHAAFAPVLAYLMLSSVSRFGAERNAGAVELVCYGPADGTAYLVGGFIRDMVLTLIALTVLVVFFAVTAAVNNFVLEPQYFLVVFACLAFSAVIFAYGAVISVITDNAYSAVAVFLGVIILFAVVQAGSFTIVPGTVRSVASTVSVIISWFSPFFYWQVGLDAVEANRFAEYALSVAGMIGLAAGMLVLGHVISLHRGVRV